MSDIADELRAFEGSEALGNGDFSACYRGAAEITRLRAALATARQDALAEIKQDTDELIEQGRQDGMEYAAQIAEGRPSDRGEDIVAAIRAAAKEDVQAPIGEKYAL